MQEEIIDIDKKILYWIEQLDFKWIDCGKLIEHIRKNYVKNKEDVVREFVEIMEWIVDIDCLDQEKICESDEDYEYLGQDLYLNVYMLENDDVELKRLNLIE